MVEFFGDFGFLREREGAKRVAMVLIWKGEITLFDSNCTNSLTGDNKNI